MTELDLYKFVQGKEISWISDSELFLWIDAEDLKEFAAIEGDGIVEDGGFKVFLVHGGTICMNLYEVCELHDIEPENILKRDE